MALQALLEDRNPLAGIAHEHAALFRVAGIAGCDIQCMPYQVCRNCRAPYRHNQRENKRCAVCGKDSLEDFSFEILDTHRINRAYIERELYRNTHLVLGRYRGYGVEPGTPQESPEQPFPEQVVQHLANVLRDASKIAGRKASNYIAFTLGWFSHVVSDALFKGVYPNTTRVNFYGRQYDMAMLPAAEAITLTDISHDFGVHWPTWHKELLKSESDGGALRHLAMGNQPDKYDQAYWAPRFGQPDTSIGKILDAVPGLNRKWLHAMYLTPDYSAATPRLDKRKIGQRAKWTFEGKDMGQLRRYAFKTGWYETFIRGVDVYLRVIRAAAAGLDIPTDDFGHRTTPGVSWNLWQRIIAESLSTGELPPDWGSALHIDHQASPLLKRMRGQKVHLSLPEPATDYQRALASLIKTAFRIKPRKDGNMMVVIGPPSFTRDTAPLLCREDMLRLKYNSGLAGIVGARESCLLIAGLSDFGDHKLFEWLSQVASLGK